MRRLRGFPIVHRIDDSESHELFPDAVHEHLSKAIIARVGEDGGELFAGVAAPS